MLNKIGFGGGCHWCTEAVFSVLKGVHQVDQGWIASTQEYANYSEAVVVHYDELVITLDVLIAIHLMTHSCTSDHKFRTKYRSAVYTYTEDQAIRAADIIEAHQEHFEKPILTMVLPFSSFRLNQEKYLNYYQKNPDGQFCQTYIHPKLSQLMRQYSAYVDNDKLGFSAEGS